MKKNINCLRWNPEPGKVEVMNYSNLTKAFSNARLLADIYGNCYVYYAGFCYNIVREYDLTCGKEED